jgi:hypothetical protein
MPQPAGRSLLEPFSALSDPRQQAKMLDPLPEILRLLLGATLAGAEGWVEIELWGSQPLAFLRRFRPYRHGIPSRRGPEGPRSDPRSGRGQQAAKGCPGRGARHAGPNRTGFPGGFNLGKKGGAMGTRTPSTSHPAERRERGEGRVPRAAAAVDRGAIDGCAKPSVTRAGAPA